MYFNAKVFTLKWILQIFWIPTQYSVAGLHSIQHADLNWMLQPIPVSLSTWMMVEGATASQVSKIVCKYNSLLP